MRTANFTPIDTEFVARLVSRICLGDEGNLLSEIKTGIVLAIHTLNFNQTDIVVLISKTTLVTKDGTINMKLWRSGRHYNIVFGIICEDHKQTQLKL